MHFYRARFLVRAALIWVVLAGFGLATPSDAADKVRVGKGINVLWTLLPPNIAVEQGLYARYGLDVEITTLTGDAKLQQALVSDSVDMGFGGGPTMAFAVKGSPIVAVAALVSSPNSFSVILPADSPIRQVSELKGRLLATATNGSVPQWLIRRLSMYEGWGPDGIRTIATGAFEASLSATLTHQVDGFMGATEAGYQLEERGKGRILTGMAQYVPNFITQVIFARKSFAAEHPDRVERFLKGTFAAVAFMKQNRAKTTEIAMKDLHQSEAVMSKTYDYEVKSLIDDGVFDPKAVAMLKDSFIEMGILKEKPADAQLFTTKFTPVKP